MTLHELKIWTDGFAAALKDQAPNKEQWKMLLTQIFAAQDESTFKHEDTAKTLPVAKKK